MKQIHRIEYEVLDHWSELEKEEQELVREAILASKRAYAPYSKFQVGAALRLDDGSRVSGNNQENIAYPSGLCAERVALFYAGANYPGRTIRTLAVFAEGDLIEPDECISPCGACRQVMAESENRQDEPIRLLLAAQSGRTFVFDKVSDLLVFPFGMKERQ